MSATSQPIRVLDHGYLRFVEAWGHGDAGSQWGRDRVATRAEDRGWPDNPDFECGIVEAARQSTQGSFRGWVRVVRCPDCGREWECENRPAYCTRLPCRNVETVQVHPGDQNLLATLYNSKPQHATPFEFAGMTVEVQAPILVYREWHRHRTQSYNEMSARYAPLPNQNYFPQWDNLKERGEAAERTRNRQQQGTHEWDEAGARAWWGSLPEFYDLLEEKYQEALRAGVPKEIARVTIPVGRYSRMRASGNLRNWLAFVLLRSDPNAQWEIRQYSLALESILAEKFPRTYDLFCKRRTG